MPVHAVLAASSTGATWAFDVGGADYHRRAVWLVVGLHDAARKTTAALNLVVHPVSMTWRFASGAVIAATPPPAPWDLLAGLNAGTVFQVPSSAAPGDPPLEIAITLQTGNGDATWLGQPLSVLLRSQPSDLSTQVFFDLPPGLVVQPGQPLTVRFDTSLPPRGPGEFYACPGGTVTFSPRIAVTVQ